MSTPEEHFFYSCSSLEPTRECESTEELIPEVLNIKVEKSSDDSEELVYMNDKVIGILVELKATSLTYKMISRNRFLDGIERTINW